MDSAHGSDLARIFGDLSQSEKLSRIKPLFRSGKIIVEKNATIINFRSFFRGYAIISPSFLKISKNARG